MTPTDPLTEVREHLIAALNADFVGPFHPEPGDGGTEESRDGEERGEEVLPLAPSRWYLTGFLAPESGRELEASDDDDESLDTSPDQESDDNSGSEPEPKRKNFAMLPWRGETGKLFGRANSRSAR